jgi:hypothetical protein
MLSRKQEDGVIGRTQRSTQGGRALPGSASKPVKARKLAFRKPGNPEIPKPGNPAFPKARGWTHRPNSAVGARACAPCQETPPSLLKHANLLSRNQETLKHGNRETQLSRKQVGRIIGRLGRRRDTRVKSQEPPPRLLKSASLLSADRRIPKPASGICRLEPAAVARSTGGSAVDRPLLCQLVP